VIVLHSEIRKEVSHKTSPKLCLFHRRIPVRPRSRIFQSVNIQNSCGFEFASGDPLSTSFTYLNVSVTAHAVDSRLWLADYVLTRLGEGADTLIKASSDMPLVSH